MTCLDRYVLHETLRPLLGLLLLFGTLFISYSAAGHLADAARGFLSADKALHLVGLRTLVALETLLPIALFVAILLALGRLYQDQEIAALCSVGISEWRLVRAVALPALVVALFVAWLSLELRPWAYAQSHWLRAQAIAELDLNRLEPGRFYESPDSQRTLFARHIVSNALSDVFIKSERDGMMLIIRADAAEQQGMLQGQIPHLRFSEGQLYQLDLDGGRDLSVRFAQLDVALEAGDVDGVGQARKATSTWQLLHSDAPKDIAEVQWRFSRPLAAFLLALLAVPLSRTAPRTGRYGPLLLALGVFVLYYNLTLLARTWVRQDVVPPLPGMWWVEGLALVVLALLLWRPRLR